MSNVEQPGPPSAWLEHLYQANQWDRLIQVGKERLALHPTDTDIHRYLAWAYVHTKQPRDCKRHLEFLLTEEPDDERNHHLAAVFHLEDGKHEHARQHIELLLRKNPASPTYHYLACISALRIGWQDAARHHIREARRLAPRWGAAAELEILMDGSRQQRAADAWNRIHRFKEALELDPRSDSALSSIGDIYLYELENPAEAERFYRQALFIEPMNRDRQNKLMDAIRARSLLYRTLSLPISAFRRLRKTRVHAIFLLIAIKVVAAYAIWLIVMGALFAPAAKLYEWFILSDITQLRGRSRFLAPITATASWPLWVRMLCAAAVIVGFWLLVLWRLLGIAPVTALEIVGFLFAVHFAFVALFVGIRRVRSRYGRWKEQRERSRTRPRAPLTDART